MNSLTDVKVIDNDIEIYLSQVGKVFRAFRDQDSDCVSFGIWSDGRRWFVKHSQEPRGIASLKRAEHLYKTVQHPVLPHLFNTFQTPGGFALVLDWQSGEVLYDYTKYSPEQRRSDPACPHVRFRSLPVGEILTVLNTIYDVHLVLAEAGFIAVDFYDGCILYDFDQSKVHLCDLDEYRFGPFFLEADRLPGSKRFMAPEEFQYGARIDQVTNVFTLGRTAIELLGDGTLSLEAWKGSAAMREVVLRATNFERTARQQSIREFVEDWQSVVS
jgi:serine/threonine-protein kinase